MIILVGENVVCVATAAPPPRKTPLRIYSFQQTLLGLPWLPFSSYFIQYENTPFARQSCAIFNKASWREMSQFILYFLGPSFRNVTQQSVTGF